MREPLATQAPVNYYINFEIKFKENSTAWAARDSGSGTTTGVGVAEAALLAHAGLAPSGVRESVCLFISGIQHSREESVVQEDTCDIFYTMSC